MDTIFALRGVHLIFRFALALSLISSTVKALLQSKRAVAVLQEDEMRETDIALGELII